MGERMGHHRCVLLYTCIPTDIYILVDRRIDL